MEHARREFLAEQLRGLDPFGFVLLTVPGAADVALQVERAEDGASYTVLARSHRPLPPGLVAALRAAGLTRDPPALGGLDVDGAAATAEQILTDALGAGEAASVDLQHGSRRAQVMTERKMAAIRARIGTLLGDIADLGPWTVDGDGDHTTTVGSTRLYVGPRTLVDGTAVVVVLSPTIVNIEPEPELGLFLVEANFHLAFGRFALDVVTGVVRFGQNLLGEGFTDEELKMTVRMVASTSDTFVKEIADRFGGEPSVSEAEADEREPPTKPGAGGYL